MSLLADALDACVKALPYLKALSDELQEADPSHDPALNEQVAIDAIEAVLVKAKGAL